MCVFTYCNIVSSNVSKKIYRTYTTMAPYCRPFLAVAPTTLRDDMNVRLPMHGLFTTQDLPAGSFLGFYNGVFRDGDYKGRDTYVMSTSDFHIRPKKTRKRVDPAQYPLAMCNEPSATQEANVFLIEFTRAKHVLPHLPAKTSIAAVGFYTCRAVRAGEELFVHYGNRFARSYPVGTACRRNKSECETPEDMMTAFGLHKFVDRECYVEYVT